MTRIGQRVKDFSYKATDFLVDELLMPLAYDIDDRVSYKLAQEGNEHSLTDVTRAYSKEIDTQRYIGLVMSALASVDCSVMMYITRHRPTLGDVALDILLFSDAASRILTSNSISVTVRDATAKMFRRIFRNEK